MLPKLPSENVESFISLQFGSHLHMYHYQMKAESMILNSSTAQGHKQVSWIWGPEAHGLYICVMPPGFYSQLWTQGELIRTRLRTKNKQEMETTSSNDLRKLDLLVYIMTYMTHQNKYNLAHKHKYKI